MQTLPARARVVEQLSKAAHFPVMLIAAPAGFGKSVALREFLTLSHPDAPIFNAQREHATLLAFVKGLSQALSPVAPSAVAAFPSLQERILAAHQPVRELSDWFVEHLKEVRTTIVIDDLHFAAADIASIALLADVIERTSDRIRWILAARSDVGLPVASWMAYGRMDFPIGEETLRLTSDEALAVSQEIAEPIAPIEVEALRRLTDGWPLALHIALRTRTRAKDLPSAAAGARDLVYRYLAEQIFTALPSPQRDFLLATSVFASFDATIAQALGANALFLSQLKREVTFLTETADGNYRYHDLFRDFLESELRRRGSAEFTGALHEGAQLLQERHDEAGALRLYARAADAPAILDILEHNGISLFERGEGESLRIAIEALPDETLRANAAALGIRAMLEAGRGHFDVAEPAFVAAIEGAQELTLRLNLVHRYAVELVRHGRDASKLLAPYAQDKQLPRNLQVPILGTLATTYVHTGQSPIAQSTIERALHLTDGEITSETRARLYQQASYVYQFVDNARARKFADLAIETALAKNLYDVAARACSVLFALAYNDLAEPSELLIILQKLGEYARKGGSEQTRLYGLIALYDLQAERGDEAALEALDLQLIESEAALPVSSNEMLLPARALREMWSGNFSDAASLLRKAAGQTTNSAPAAITNAHFAICAFASGSVEDGVDALRTAADLIAESQPTAMQRIRAHLLIAIAELVRGHLDDAHRDLMGAERTTPAKAVHMKAFVHAVRTAHRIKLGHEDDAAWRMALEQMHLRGLGGFARMLGALPMKASGEGFSTLTPAEQEIVRMLARGASSKEIASKTDRSAQTVDTHIRSICRKLGCSGRRQAVALATAKGWVQMQTPGTTEP